MHTNPELELAERFVKYTNRNIFLTGKAGTGKTSFLKSLKLKSPKRMVVLAPTGVAAINAGGVTIHSFFQLPFGPILTERVVGHKLESEHFKQKFNKRKINIFKTLDLLIIDEISMVRADILDAIDEILRKYKNRFKPFGGVQLLMIGDLQQLPPVVREDEFMLMKPYYPSLYFFNSYALKYANMMTIELKHIYRQKDDLFVKILNEIRDDKLTEQSYHQLHERFIPDFKPSEKGFITLTTHNRTADNINKEKLRQLEGETFSFFAQIKGQFPEHAYPTDFELKLKIGTQVMFIKNDSSPEKRYFNGKIGEVIDFEDDKIIVRCEGDEIIETGQELWQNIKYNINQQTKKINEEFVGSFTQYPLRLAWAITIHKSQGLTFEKAVIDAADAFAHGQTYVAFSRCKTLEGLVLSSRISESAIICDKEVSDFNKKTEENQPDEKVLQDSINRYQIEIISDLFSYKQLEYRFETFEKRLTEYAGAYTGNIGVAVLEITKTTLPKIKSIANTFMKQVTKLLQENSNVGKNEKLQERLKQAGKYFIDFHNKEFITKIENSSFESDNATVAKAIEQSISSVNEILHIKQKSLKVCQNGFKIKDYMDTRAKAALEDQRKLKRKIATKQVETKHPELYSVLKYWRQEQAEIENVNLYMIVSNKALQDICDKLPVTKKQLEHITGIGRVKIQHYGEDIISIVQNYIDENNIEPRSDSYYETKPVKEKNHKKSFELFKAGKSIPEIAAELGFVVSTIENHICRYIASGEINIEKLVEPKIAKIITDYFKTNPQSTLTEAKAALPDEITFSQLRMVKAHFKSME